MNILKHHKIIFSTLVVIIAIAISVNKLQSFYYFNNTKISYLGNSSSNTLEDYYLKSLEIQKSEKQIENKVSLLAVGDIMLSRNVAKKIKEANNFLLPFKNFKEISGNVDFSFGNLESPISGSNDFNLSGSMVFNTPPAYIEGLIKNNFKILSLANNHAFDQDLAGLEYTIQYLDKNNIKHIGAGNTLEEAWAPAFVEQNGIKICFIGASYASINDNGKTTNNYVARIEDLENLKSSIQNIKSTCDFIIATMHAGTEYTTKPNQAQIDFAHSAIDFGADMVIGHHPHWVQEIEKYCPSFPSSPGEEKMPEGQMRLNCQNPKYIFYSLGNFIFDQMWSQETREGLVLKIQISKNKNQSELQGPKNPSILKNIELIPIIIDNYSTPRKASEEEGKKILEKIKQSNSFLLQ